jgi:hypothetical protein
MKFSNQGRWTSRAWQAGVVLATAFVAACGGGGGGGGGGSPVTYNNVAAITVDGQYQSFNSLFVTVQICQHGSTSNCVTVDHVAIDTGSIGLRVLQSSLASLNSTFLQNLPTVTATASTAAVTGPLAECEQFGGGYTWGSVRNVDISIPGTNETASNIPMQVIGDLSASEPTCATQSTTGYQLTGENYTTNMANPLTNTYLYANGLIGVSLFQWDCIGCTSTAEPQDGDPATATLTYVVCPDMTGNGCQPTTLPLAQQVQNPIYGFSTDNNGYILQMGNITSTSGSTTAVSGTMTFGIGTQGNNGVGSATTFEADPYEEPGIIQTTWQGTTYDGLFDTGSNFYYFANTTNPTIALCGTTAPDDQVYCPGGTGATAGSAGTTLSLEASIQPYTGASSPSSTVDFSITNLFVNTNPNAIAANNVGGTVVFDYFIWGMPYFYGRKLYFGLAGINATTQDVTTNPYYAF